MPVIKKEYVATGKVKYIYRDFPTDAMALKAAMLARCLPEKRYFGFIDTLFRQRDQWINSEGNLEPMKQLAALAGLGGAKADACLADKKLEESLLRQRLQASNLLNIDATPTIIIDGEKFTGEHTAEEVRKVLDKAVAKAAKKKK
jgi:protein-disulfide isomerase